MDIQFGPQAEAFRRDLRAWLKENLPAEWQAGKYLVPDTETERHQMRMDWGRRLYEAGWAAPQWPVEYGGRGLGPLEYMIYIQEMGQVGLFDVTFTHGKNLLGPILIQAGSEWQKRRFLPKILSGEEFWCQGYSEPGAGSDLASIQTQAVLDGDEWVITGQKIWTSWAQYADWCFCLCRTDRDAPKHKGISFLLVNMRQPGVTVRPIRQATGHSEFNEVFFDGVRTPRDHVVGAVNDGWRIANSLLPHERGGIAFIRETRIRQELEQIATFAGTVPRGRYTRAIDDPVIRHRLAQLDMELENLRLTNYRYLSRYVRDDLPGAEGSVTKIGHSELHQRLLELSVDLMGPRADLWRGAPGSAADGYLIKSYLMTRGFTIGGGTSEIQRGIIADRILGLPR